MEFYKFIYKYLGNKRKYLFYLLGLSIISNLLMILIPILQKKLLSGVIIKDINNKILIMFIAVIAISILISFLIETIIQIAVSKLKRILQEELINSVLLTNNPIIQQKGAGAYLVSIFGDTEQIANLLKINIFDMFFQTITAIIIIIISYQWSLLFIKIVLPLYVIAIIVKIWCQKHFLSYFKQARELVYETNPQVLEYIENRNSLLSVGNVFSIKENLYNKFNERDRFFLKASLVNNLEDQLTKNLKVIALLIFYVFAMFDILHSKMEIATFVALTAYFSYVFLPLSSIKEYLLSIEKFKMIKQKINAGLEYEVTTKIPRNNDLIMKNCSFNYGDKNILLNINLNINKKIGLVGLSGEGKTTLIKILLGINQPTSGSCCYGDINTFELNKYILRSSIRYYQQESELFASSVKDNICLNLLPLTSSKYQECYQQNINKIKDCIDRLNSGIKLNKIPMLLELLGLNKDYNQDCFQSIVEQLININDSQIENLASIYMARNYYCIEKYQQIIDQLELNNLEQRLIGQRGYKVSGGEKNRILLARFLLPEHADKYIIDEPFISLDKISEQAELKILKSYLSSMQGITISHKLDVIRDLSDEIVVLENGVITDFGSHQYLYQNNKLYKSLIDLS